VGLWESLRKDCAGARRVVYPRSSKAAAPAPIAGVSMEAPVMYETVSRPFDFYVTQRSDVVTVASPSVAEALQGVPMLPRAAALGPTTGAALRRCRIEPWLEVRDATFEGFARAIAGRVG
jgi:uroporphyrinogen-III synthase